MTYNKTYHRWVLAITDCDEIGDVKSAYGGEANALRELAKQSRTLYLAIYEKVPLSNKDYIEYNLAKCAELEPIIKEALLAQLEYDLSSGGNSVNKQVGLDFKSGVAIDRKEMKSRQVAIEAMQILQNASSAFNIFYPVDFGQVMESTRYTDFDY